MPEQQQFYTVHASDIKIASRVQVIDAILYLGDCTAQDISDHIGLSRQTVMKAIRYFLTVADSGSFTNAAKQLYTSQSTLSKTILTLEQMLGVTLFIRSHKRLILTEAGNHLYQKWQGLLTMIEQSVEECRVLQGGYSNMLTIGLLDSQDPEAFAMPSINAFRQTHPQINVSVNTCPAQEIRQRLIRGNLDLVYTVLYDQEQLSSEDLEYLIVSECTHNVAMLPSNPLAEKEYLEVKDLKDSSFVAISPLYTPSYCGMLRDLCGKEGFEPRFVRYVNSALSLAYNLVEADDIFIADRNYRIYQHPSFSNLQFRPLIHTKSGIAAVWSKNNTKKELAQFIRELK